MFAVLKKCKTNVRQFWEKTAFLIINLKLSLLKFILFSDSYGRNFIYRPTLRSVATQTDELESIVISDEDEPQKDVVIVISDDESDVEGIS